jgi:hypothetical protein
LNPVLLPALKHTMRAMLLRYRLWRVMRRLLALPVGLTPTPRMLEDLRRAWGNTGYAADLDYLLETAYRATTTSGPILECGTGLTTILLGLLAGRRGVAIWSLEHISEWATYVRGVSARYRLPRTHILISPLKDYGTFTWYDPPLANMPDHFRLVICDGPPETGRGDRYGLLPIVGQRLPPGSTILLDDVERPEEEALLRRWEREARWSADRRATPNGTLAVITCVQRVDRGCPGPC